MLVDESHQLKENGVRIDHFKKRAISVLFTNTCELKINGQKICQAKIKQKKPEAVILVSLMKIDF